MIQRLLMRQPEQVGSRVEEMRQMIAQSIEKLSFQPSTATALSEELDC